MVLRPVTGMSAIEGNKENGDVMRMSAKPARWLFSAGSRTEDASKYSSGQSAPYKFGNSRKMEIQFHKVHEGSQVQ